MHSLRKIKNNSPQIPIAPRSIQKGSTLKDLLDREAIDCLVHNLSSAYRHFDGESFRLKALHNLEPLGIMERGKHLAKVMREHLPQTL